MISSLNTSFTFQQTRSQTPAGTGEQGPADGYAGSVDPEAVGQTAYKAQYLGKSERALPILASSGDVGPGLACGCAAEGAKSACGG